MPDSFVMAGVSISFRGETTEERLFNMQERHTDGQRYFRELAYTSEKYLLPFIEQVKKVTSDTRVLEIGCGMGGNLSPFVERGCRVMGVDLGKDRVENAARMLKAEGNPRIELICADIFTVTHLKGCFDLIIVHDVIEHIPDKDRFFEFVREFLKPGGVIFLAFPAWQMPFGGHQQICRSRFLSKLPFYHLLPRFMYKGLLQAFHEPREVMEELLSIKSCGLTIERCRRYLRRYHYTVEKQKLYFINPHYEIKFHLKPRLLFSWMGSIPYVRNFFCTSCFLMVKDGL